VIWDAPITKTLLFDLDGTLVRLHRRYSLELRMMFRAARRFRDVVPPFSFPRAFWRAARLAQSHDSRRPNHEILVSALSAQSRADEREIFSRMEDLTTHDFCHMQTHFRPIRGAREILETARARGHRVVLATNPVWPERAVKMRLGWGGLADFRFDFVSHSQVMTRCKPSLGYYRELLTRLGARPDECVMIGDNPKKDLPATELGIRTFLLSKGRPAADRRLDGWGSLEDLHHWLTESQAS
jgi:HAD superfamily hydrolase (TIGR01509 family)